MLGVKLSIPKNNIMETLKRNPFIKSKVAKPNRVIKTVLSPNREQKPISTKAFDLPEYLSNSKGYVLGHAAFTK